VLVPDPENRAGTGPRSERVDDWELEELDWSGETPASPDSATGGRSSRIGLVTGIAPGRSGDQSGTSSAVRRRRMVALAAVGLLVVLAVVIPLVVFGGGGSSTEPTAAPTTTARSPTRTEPSATTTTSTTPATTQPTPKPLRVALPAGAALRRGSRGSEVRDLQKGLAALGYAAGEPDGVFGQTTEAAVVDFQRSNNLAPDGIVGADTARLLNAALADRKITG
jgi:hypothetical protein